MRLSLFSSVFYLLTITGCKINSQTILSNESIDKDKRIKIHKLNEDLFNEIKDRNIQGLRASMSENFLMQDGSKIDRLIYSASDLLQGSHYKIIDEYNTISENLNTSLQIFSSGENIGKYHLNLTTSSKDMYISLLQSTESNFQFLITIIYGKYGNDWKINTLQIGEIKALGKTAIDYYKLAKQQYEKKYLLDALTYGQLVQKCIKPASQIFHYEKESEINEFFNKVFTEGNQRLQLPITVSDLQTKPVIFKVFPQVIDEGVYPLICYQTSINLMESAALKKENNSIKAKVGSIFYGINHDKKYVFYWAFNDIPADERKSKHFAFIDSLNSMQKP